MAQDIPNPKPTTEIPISKELEVKNDSIPNQEIKKQIHCMIIHLKYLE